MRKHLFLVPVLLGAGLGACTGAPHPDVTNMRPAASSMSFLAAPQDDVIMAEQSKALAQAMDKIVRESTIKHAAIGAAVGCGVAVLASTGASKCLVGAAAGGAMGAVSGVISGKRDVAHRLELVSANQLVRTIRASRGHLTSITSDLPEMLANQEAEVLMLQQQKASGVLSHEDYDARVGSIRAARTELAETLLLSSQQAAVARSNLSQAAAQGQSGLEWHMGAIDQMERDTLSARAQISLL